MICYFISQRENSKSRMPKSQTKTNKQCFKFQTVLSFCLFGHFSFHWNLFEIWILGFGHFTASLNKIRKPFCVEYI
jgi:hypothetical protein